MPSTIVFRNAFLIDGTGRPPMGRAAVIVEDDRIKTVVADGDHVAVPKDAVTIDLQGKTLMPGLTDAHVNSYMLSPDVGEQERSYPQSLIVARALRRAERMLYQGFTTVRDMAGADWGFKQAIDQGYYQGPRMLVSCATLTQTGGHGDFRKRAEDASHPPHTCDTWVVDGVDEMRRAVRELNREGADQIQVMASGGIISPNDDLDTTQFSPGELRAAVEEATAAKKYVAADAHSAAGAKAAAEAGARSIEHGSLVDLDAANALKKANVYLVPTLTGVEMAWRRVENGNPDGLPDSAKKKLETAHAAVYQSLKLAYSLGIKIASGSDLWGDLLPYQAMELELKGKVMKPMDVLVSATKTNAELFNMDKDIGTVEPGKLADLIVVDGNPLQDLKVLQNTDNLKLIMKGGAIYKNVIKATAAK